MLTVDGAHTGEGELVGVSAVPFTAAEMKEWFGGTLPRLDTADEYRPLLAPHVERLDAQLEAIRRALGAGGPAPPWAGAFFPVPPPPRGVGLLGARDALPRTPAPPPAFR